MTSPIVEAQDWAIEEQSIEDTTNALEAFRPELPKRETPRSTSATSSERPSVSRAEQRVVSNKSDRDEIAGIGQTLRPAFITPEARAIVSARVREFVARDWALIVAVVAFPIAGIFGWFLGTPSAYDRRIAQAETQALTRLGGSAPAAPERVADLDPPPVSRNDAPSGSLPASARPQRLVAAGPPAAFASPRSVDRDSPPAAASGPVLQPAHDPGSTDLPLPVSVMRAGASGSPSRANVNSGDAEVPLPRDHVPAQGATSRGLSAPPVVSQFIYGDDDVDVTQPTVLFPLEVGVLPPASAGAPLDALTIAIVVNTDGTVESARAVNAPQNIGDLMLITSALSAVKSWRFQPATRDGSPVRYRRILPFRLINGLSP